LSGHGYSGRASTVISRLAPESAMKAQFKRTRIWIYPSLQSAMLLRLMFYLVSCTLFLFHVAFLYEVIVNVPDVLSRGVLAFYLDFCIRLVPLFVALIFVAPIFLYDMVKFSHRFAGPLYRFRKTVEAMAAGKPVEPVKIRKRDLLFDWVSPFNALIRRWNALQAVEDDVPVAELVEEETEEPVEATASGALS
jgi:hypothetical protein